MKCKLEYLQYTIQASAELQLCSTLVSYLLFPLASKVTLCCFCAADDSFFETKMNHCSLIGCFFFFCSCRHYWDFSQRKLTSKHLLICPSIHGHRERDRYAGIYLLKSTSGQMKGECAVCHRATPCSAAVTEQRQNKGKEGKEKPNVTRNMFRKQEIAIRWNQRRWNAAAFSECVIPAEEIGALVRVALQCWTKGKGRQTERERETQHEPAYIRRDLRLNWNAWSRNVLSDNERQREVNYNKG